MPIYEYRCDDCRTKFEKFVRYPDRDEVLCPSCGKNHLTQLISAFRAIEPGKARPAARFSPEHGHPEERAAWAHKADED
jgi:putative FmdB family regulatory protein